MGREAAIFVYLLVFRLFFHIFKWYPQKKKSTFVASFGDNILFTVEELEKQTDEQVVILKTSQCKVNFEERPNRIILHFELRHFMDWVRSIYHLATSPKIFVDNYFGFLAAADFKPNVTCIQLWHAAGAIKQFGLKDPSIENRSQRAMKRFKKVYDRFHYVVVGSEKMACIFKQSFGLSDERIVRSGIPRTDFFFDSEAMGRTAESLRSAYPLINEKKVILYAPTFRDGELTISQLALDIDNMYQELKDEYALFLRLHPAVRADFTNQYPDFICDVSDCPDVNHLLLITDILVTDYSSIPFEFSLLHKPMIFFAYDLEEYAETRGFWEPYEKMVPGPIVGDTDELIQVINDGDINIDAVRDFANEWNEYSTGRSSEKLIQMVYTNEKARSLY
ncbi:CDP-glycerol--glycerophosphate glycerophosphotransferase [Pueribacillus theae]|uniref:CDP-glycerol--glycerophosphate glycerophosphotransferase n=1 Tax=Pueribacillus theae TaxID=2171751 RepID=A0A2U1K5S0_9BACI|nr:CDP-glycerol glycerophosphotransferase family protein [Pueribacillus theae]PWA12876.1 CDP-glycerol--glycerophosphate glycerophosphotransferase [Pueribacillus theae]